MHTLFENGNRINIITALVGTSTIETELEWNTKTDVLSLSKFWYMTEIKRAKTSSSFASIEKSNCFPSHRYFSCRCFIRVTIYYVKTTELITFTLSGCSSGDEELPIDHWNIKTKRNASVLKQKRLTSRAAWNL